ncbi:MAG: hypothetical protein EPO58_13745 [Chitinophagaceae bacterium]|nr:hypothetical protein [Bacteroidota bacterium]TAJ50394.1 MAG: hypothetical protein EPO58_13745 [Chitinophagaceae bacterium]
MSSTIRTKDIGAIIHDLKNAELSVYEQSLLAQLEARLEKGGLSGQRILSYHLQPLHIKAMLEEEVVTLLQTQQHAVEIQLHAPPETTLVLADLFYLRIVMAAILHYLADHAGLRTLSLLITRGEEKCILEVDQPVDPYVVELADKETRASNVLAVCRKLMEEMNGELIYTHSGKSSNYFNLKIPLA